MEFNLLIDNKNHYFDEYLSLIKTTVDSEEKNIEIESHRIDSLRPSTPIDGIE